jgi:hypothetical protein
MMISGKVVDSPIPMDDFVLDGEGMIIMKWKQKKKQDIDFVFRSLG